MKTLPTTTTLSLLSLLAGACAMGDNTQPGGALLAEGVPVPDAAPSVDARAPREELDPTAAAYYTVTVSDGVFYANFDDNGSGPGDPIPGNDMQMVWGTLVEGPPTDFIFINMYEGIGSFALDGAIRDFGSFELPATIDLADAPEELNYNTCGLCISILSDVTIDDGELTNYDHQLAAVGGTITFDKLPVEPDQAFSATINNVELAEIDLYGEFVEDGRTRFVPRIEFSVIPSSN